MLNPFARRDAARLLSAIALALLFAGPGLAANAPVAKGPAPKTAAAAANDNTTEDTASKGPSPDSIKED